jgi:hypothetical protein
MFPDGSIKLVTPDGAGELMYSDGTIEAVTTPSNARTPTKRDNS